MKEFGEYVRLAEVELESASRHAGSREDAEKARAEAMIAAQYIELAKLALEIEMES